MRRVARHCNSFLTESEYEHVISWQKFDSSKEKKGVANVIVDTKEGWENAPQQDLPLCLLDVLRVAAEDVLCKLGDNACIGLGGGYAQLV